MTILSYYVQVNDMSAEDIQGMLFVFTDTTSTTGEGGDTASTEKALQLMTSIQETNDVQAAAALVMAIADAMIDPVAVRWVFLL